MSTQQILGAVGTVVGAYFGYPQLGYAIGSAIGGAIDPEVIKGPSIGDIAKQTSMEGVPRPIIWALSPPMGGNIIASSEPKIVRKRQRQGKGGPKVESEHVYRTYAVGVCEGPINRFVRIWRNNTLVYDVSEFPLLTTADNLEFLKRARITFLGGWTQNPSPALERIFGVGTTPSYRGTAILVMDDEELTDLRGAIPQWMFQVERCEGFYLTSRPYPIEAEDALGLGFSLAPSVMWAPPDEALGLSFGVLSGTLITPLVTYPGGEPEALQVEFSVGDGTIEEFLVTYGDGAPEAVEMEFSVVDGTIEDFLVTYDNYPPEALGMEFAVLDGTLV